jgi:alkylhydroperoxidase family enzyme
MLEFDEKLNFQPSGTTEVDVQKLRDAGFSDENILDIVALTAYRNFMNRLHGGLGLSLDNLRERFGDDLVDSFGPT